MTNSQTNSQATAPSQLDAMVFDSLYVGSFNREAAIIGSAIPAEGAVASNPLFIHSPSGMGKTHILRSIDVRLGDRAKFCTAREFREIVISGELESLLRSEVVLIDDIHHLKGTLQFNGIRDLLNSKPNTCSLVLSATTPAMNLPFPDELINKIMGGLSCAISYPILSERLSLLEKWNGRVLYPLPPEAIEFLGTRLRSSIRKLKGAYVKVAHIEAMDPKGNRWSNQLLADTLVDSLLGEGTISLSQVLQAVANSNRFDGVGEFEILGRRRTARIALPRQVAMYLSRKLTNHSLAEIGKHFRGRDHGTVIHAIKRIEQRMSISPEFAAIVSDLAKQIKHG